jgi:O-antigen/teichoic acid export membrane protein
MYDGLYTFLIRLARIGLTAGLAVLTARVLGPAGRGIYALPGVEAALVASAFGGLTSATTFFLLNRKPDRTLLHAIFAATAIMVVAAAAAVVPLTLLAGQRAAVIPAIAVLPSFALISLVSGYSLGIKQVRFSSTVNTLQTLFTVVAMMIAFAIAQRTPGVAIAAWVCGTSIAGLISLWYILFNARRDLRGGDTVGFREYWRFCLKVTSVNIVALLNYRADVYIVALFLPPAALGMYSIAVAGAESLLVPTQVAALVTSPHIGSMELREAALLTARCVRHNMLISMVICVPLFFFAGPVVRILYGPKFLPLVPSFDILLAGVFVLALSSPISSYFTLKLGRPQIPLRLATISAVICIGVTLLLVRAHGIAGAAIGSTAGYFVGQALGLWYFERRAHIGARLMLLPTISDLRIYWSFLVRVLQDGRRLLRPVP